MRILTIASQKGGAGKTTLTAHVAVEAERAGAGPVAVVDTDPQGSLAAWWNTRQAYFHGSWCSCEHESSVAKFDFWQNPKIGYQEFNDLQSPKLSKKQLCDRIGHGGLVSTRAQ
jgi:cellulose biosynthesis protein BcsQ